MKVCVDANIVVKFLLPSLYPEAQAQWHAWASEGYLFVAPALLNYEAVNAFYQMYRQGSLTAQGATSAIRSLSLLPIELVSDPQYHLDAFEIASTFRIKAAYDAHYVAVAQRLGVELWTSDKRLYNAVHAHLDFIRLVDQV